MPYVYFLYKLSYNPQPPAFAGRGCLMIFFKQTFNMMPNIKNNIRKTKYCESNVINEINTKIKYNVNGDDVNT